MASTGRRYWVNDALVKLKCDFVVRTFADIEKGKQSMDAIIDRRFRMQSRVDDQQNTATQLTMRMHLMILAWPYVVFYNARSIDFYGMQNIIEQGNWHMRNPLPDPPADEETELVRK
jgi:hypothetical protein